MKIGDRSIGQGYKCFVIAEIANNHDQKKAQAIELIELAGACGADAVKFQTFTGLDIVCKNQLSKDYDWPPALKYKYWYQFLDSIMLPFEWYPELIEHTHKLGMKFIATPCSTKRAFFLADVGVDALKVASMDNNNIPFLEDISVIKLPVIISSGMAELEMIEKALLSLKYLERKNIAILHCVSNYPTKSEDMHLFEIENIKSKFQTPVGFSDHSIHNYGAFAAVALGANIIEKHFTISKELEGPDHFFSITPVELQDLINGIRESESAVKQKSTKLKDKNSRKYMYRSIHSSKAIVKGTLIKKDNIEIKRPEGGLHPEHYNDIIGKKVSRDLKEYQPVTWDDLS